MLVIILGIDVTLRDFVLEVKSMKSIMRPRAGKVQNRKQVLVWG